MFSTGRLGIPRRQKSTVKYCRACGSSKTRILFEVRQCLVRRCCECTHVYLDVTHDSESIRGLYADYGNGGQSQYFSGIDEEVERNLDHYLGRCKATLRDGSGELRLLDVGCGTGALLRRAMVMGFAGTGVEICTLLALKVSRELDCQVHEQFLTELALPESSFDVVTMYDLIEHLQDPRKELEEVFRILRPGGVFFALTPNDEALLRHISRMLYRLSFRSFDGAMQRLYYPDHLSYFTPESLTRLLHGIGFQIVASEAVNQELSRLQLSQLEKLTVRLILLAGRPFTRSRGKLVVYARKP